MDPTRDVTEEWLALGAEGSPESSLVRARPPGVAAGDWDAYLLTVVMPFVGWLRTRSRRIVGLAGPPGSGKTTLVRLVASSLASTHSVLPLSLDDFYLSREQRVARRLRWRGGPGSHDLDEARAVLAKIRDRATPIEVPRFSPEIDDRGQSEVLTHAPDVVLLDGWFLGYRGDGYSDLLPLIDVLVFLDVDVSTARARRFAREEALRAAGGGFSESDMSAFWEQVLEPGLTRWMPQARESADVVLEIGADQRLRAAHASGKHAMS